MDHDKDKKLTQVFLGTCLFSQNKLKAGLSKWRMSNDGIKILRPFLKSNLAYCGREFFLFLIVQKNSIDFKELLPKFEKEKNMI